MAEAPPMQMQPKSASGFNTNCPPGLEYLAQIDQVLVQQQVELIEALTGFETNNKYQIKNSMGQQIYFAAEETDCLMRQCCGSGRGFTINIVDNAGQKVMKVTRPFKCWAGCCWCATPGCNGCAHEITVESPEGTPIGYVRQGQSFCNPVYHILDADMREVFICTRHCCMCQCICFPNDLNFNLYTLQPGGTFDKNSDPVARVAKQWAGCCKEGLTDADNFQLSFPMDLDVKMKATMIGLAFLIDFMYFEDDGNNNNN